MKKDIILVIGISFFDLVKVIVGNTTQFFEGNITPISRRYLSLLSDGRSIFLISKDLVMVIVNLLHFALQFVDALKIRGLVLKQVAKAKKIKN